MSVAYVSTFEITFYDCMLGMKVIFTLHVSFIINTKINI